MATRIGINGFGRMGRLALRAGSSRSRRRRFGPGGACVYSSVGGTGAMTRPIAVTSSVHRDARARAASCLRA